MDQKKLPHLLYLGDVPVESSYHGSALLYRLLQDYPPEKLRIVETNLMRSLPERRLTGVTYGQFPLGHPRPLRTRFARAYSSWLTIASGRGYQRVAKLLDGFQPQAVVTVAHGYSWDAAARFAADRQLPLHLICHDDWPRFANVFPFLKRRVDRRLGAVYQQASSRLCVSPFMRDAYRERYGVSGEVLYPSREADAVVHEAPPAHLRKQGGRLTVAFGGTVNTPGYVRALVSLADALAPLGGRLLIFGPLTAESARRQGLDRPNVELRGLVSSAVLMERFRAEVDVLFVPMSFNPEDRPNMEISFPSKLTDYTAVGLPLLIHGPEYCSAVRWARENRDVAEVVPHHEATPLAAAVRKLGDFPELRWRLGQTSLAVGERTFSHRMVRDQFYQALNRN
jgi:hypothetical protein